MGNLKQKNTSPNLIQQNQESDQFMWKYLNKCSSVSIMSYNILADVYCEQSHFPYCSNIEFSVRSKKIVDQTIDLSADVITFQEVDHFEDFYKAKLEKYYELYYYQRPTKQDGLLIGLKKDQFEILDQKFVDNDQISKQMQYDLSYQRQNIAVIITLKQKQSQKIFKIATTHIYWNPRNEDIKFHQVCNLFQELKNQNDSHPIIITGDFNSLPDSNTVQFILNNLEPNQSRMGYQDKKIFQNIQQEYIKFNSANEQFFKFKSAYQDDQNLKHPQYTNYTQKFYGNIDYIFFSPEHFKVNKILEIPEEKWVSSEIALPNRIFPSDHLPIMTELLFLW